tara:strand:- start:989 stop:2521 length:1533 start_codon:yes stop_codon:yes gene_type:complete
MRAVARINPYFFAILSFYLVLVISSHLIGFSRLSSIQDGWAEMTIITAFSFLLILFSKVSEDSRSSKVACTIVLSLNILELLNNINPVFIWPQLLDKSSIATSVLLILCASEQYFARYKDSRPALFLIDVFLYSASGLAIMAHLVNPTLLYTIPTFETLSWNTALFFMIISSINLSYYFLNSIRKMSNHRAYDFSSKAVGFTYRYGIAVPILLLILLTVLEFIWHDQRALFGGFLSILIVIAPLSTIYALKKEIQVWLKQEQEAQEKIKEQNARLNHKNKLLRSEAELRQQAAQITSHNLRGTALAVRNVIDLLEQEELKPEELKEFRSLIKQRAEENVQILDDLGDFYNKINQEDSLLEKCVWQLEIARVFKQCEFESQKKGKLEIETSLPSVMYPKLYFTSLIYNIISNAFKYRSLERQLHLKVRSYLQDNFLVFEFEDNGVGIDVKKFKNKLFKYGNTFHGEQSSRGLGLFMTKAQLARYGHEIEMHSKLDHGSILKVKFAKQPQMK